MVTVIIRQKSAMNDQGLRTLLGLTLVFSIFIASFQTSLAFKDSDDEEDDDDVDFEFEDSTPEPKLMSGKSNFNENDWNQNVLCKNLQCKPHQVCIVRTQSIAVCISRNKLQYNGKSKSDVSDEEDPHLWPDPSPGPCHTCPVSSEPQFVCAADNQTYSSKCRLQYHNCVHKTNYAVLCEGFCPCKGSVTEADLKKEAKLKERWNNYMNKFQNTLNKSKPKSQSIDSEGTVTKKSYKITSPSRTPDFDKSTQVISKGQQKKSCTREDLKMMGDRLLDWFSVVMADHEKPKSKNHHANKGKGVGCKVEVKWMLQHLDTNGDGQLSLRELYDLEHDEREFCLQPYLAHCDANRDLFLSSSEWCACFEKSKRPCKAARERSPENVNGAYVPQCDEDGYYLPRQCHSSIGMCWCVDEHGVEFKNTRRKGFPDCVGMLKRALHKPREEDDQEDDSYEDQEEGSADKPLDF